MIERDRKGRKKKEKGEEEKRIRARKESVYGY